MPIAKESGGNFTPVPAGTHVARCFAVVSLGTQHNPQFADAFKVMLQWEIPGETIEIDGTPTPMTVGKEYTLSLSEKANLRRDLEGWRGRPFTDEELKGFAVETVVGHACMLTVLHKVSGKGKTYAAISSISKMPKGLECPKQHHASVVYEIEHGRDKTFQALPEWIQKKIQACMEWTHPTVDSEAEPALTDGETVTDDVPF